MKRSALTCSLVGLLLFGVASSDAASVTVRHRDGRHRDRTTVIVRAGHPIKRTMHRVVVRRPAVAVRMSPVVFAPVIGWRPVVVERPRTEAIVWQDAEELGREDGWSEVVFSSEQRGERLYLDVRSGTVQFDFAEVVFENGGCQVVDFADKSHRRGFYLLADFKDGRKVDHVRLVARARTDQARVALLMAR